MWVVVVGIVPVIWYYNSLKLEQKPAEVQLRFWVRLMILVASLGFFISMVNSCSGIKYMGAGGYLLLMVVAVVASTFVIDLWFRLCAWTKKRAEENGTGVIGEIHMWLIIDVVAIVTLIVLALI